MLLAYYLHNGEPKILYFWYQLLLANNSTHIKSNTKTFIIRPLLLFATYFCFLRKIHILCYMNPITNLYLYPLKHPLSYQIFVFMCMCLCGLYVCIFMCAHLCKCLSMCIHMYMEAGGELGCLLQLLLYLYVEECVGMVHAYKYGSASLCLKRPEKDIRYLPLLFPILLSHDQWPSLSLNLEITDLARLLGQ